MTSQNSVFCMRAPELNGHFRGWNSDEDPSVPFDPTHGKSVLKRSQQNTELSCEAGSGSEGSNTMPAGFESPSRPRSPTPARDIGNFGSCSVPEIEFGAGFDNRKETSFRPVDHSERC